MEFYLAFIWLFGGNFAPRGSVFCWGQTLSIAQNSALFALLGTTYGGNGQTTFVLPDLRGRMAVGYGNGPGLSPNTLGEITGTENVTLNITQMPAHTHIISLTNTTVTVPASAQPGTSATPDPTLGMAKLPTIGGGPTAQAVKGYAVPDGSTFLKPGTLGGTATASLTGNNTPVNVQNPQLVLSYCIALEGIFPSRN